MVGKKLRGNKKYTDAEIRMPVKSSRKVELVDTGKKDSYGEPLCISKLTTTDKKVQGISASSREQKNTWQRMSPEANKLKQKKKRQSKTKDEKCKSSRTRI